MSKVPAQPAIAPSYDLHEAMESFDEANARLRELAARLLELEATVADKEETLKRACINAGAVQFLSVDKHAVRQALAGKWEKR